MLVRGRWSRRRCGTVRPSVSLGFVVRETAPSEGDSLWCSVSALFRVVPFNFGDGDLGGLPQARILVLEEGTQNL